MDSDSLPSYASAVRRAGRPTGYRSLAVLIIYMIVVMTLNVAASTVILMAVDLSHDKPSTTPWENLSVWFSIVALIFLLYAIFGVWSAHHTPNQAGGHLGFIIFLGALVWCMLVIGSYFGLQYLLNGVIPLQQSSSGMCVYISAKSHRRTSPGFSGCSVQDLLGAESMCCCDSITFRDVSSCEDVFDRIIPLMYFSTSLYCFSGLLMMVLIYWACVMRCSCAFWSVRCGPFPTSIGQEQSARQINAPRRQGPPDYSEL